MTADHHNHLYNRYCRLHEARQLFASETDLNLDGYWREHISDLTIAINHYIVKNGLDVREAKEIEKRIEELKK